MSKTIALTLMGMVFCVSPPVAAQTSPTPPAARAAPLQTPAQRMEAAQNLSNTEADGALAQLNAYRKAMGLSVLVKNAPLTAAAMRHSLYRSFILADNKEAENFDVNGTPGSHLQMIASVYHRSGVLGFQWDEAGFGVIDKEPVMVLGAHAKPLTCPRSRWALSLV